MRVIVSADDFGRSKEINEAVLLAYHRGILTSASLMVNGEAAEEAVALAKENPGISVGLHLVVVNGRAALPPERIPHLVNSNDFFKGGPATCGLRYYFNPQARNELALEVKAQFERFSATGLPLSHVDGHLHMHLHPSVFKVLLPLAVQYRASGIRIPRDDFWLAIRYDHRHPAMKIGWAIAFGLLSQWASAKVRNSGLVQAHRVYGLMQSGNMDEAYVRSVLSQMDVPTAEIYFHPTTGLRTHELGSNREDLSSLLSPTIKQLLNERGIYATTYPRLLERMGRSC